MNILLDRFFIYEEKKAPQEPQEIYSQGKSQDSPGSFGFEGARKINQRSASKIFKTPIEAEEGVEQKTG